MLSLRLPALVLLLASLACTGTDATRDAARRRDVLTIATPAWVSVPLPPFVVSTQGKQVVDLLFDHLAQPSGKLEASGDSGFRPQLASSWAWAPDSLSIAFHIDSSARWHDGQPVRAADVKFSLALYTDPLVASPHAQEFAGIDSVSVSDSLTAVVWWARRNSEQFFQVAYNLSILPEHLLAKEPRATLQTSAFAAHPIGSGRYRFGQWAPQERLILLADTLNYQGGPGFGRVVWLVATDAATATMSVLSGETDVLESVRGDAFVKARNSPQLHTIEYGSFDYAYMMFNVERAAPGEPRLFGDRALRVVLTEALDRQAMVTNALDSLGRVALGPFTRSESTADTTLRQIAFNAVHAAQALDSLGWKMDPRDSLRKKNGRALHFELLLPAASATRQQYGVLIQAGLRELGIEVDLTSAETAVFESRVQAGDFDAALNMWVGDASPGTVRQAWGSPHGKDAGANYGRYSNVHFDALLDSATASRDVAERRALFQRAYQVIVDDAAAVWLYEPRNFIAVNTRVEPVGMRADAWWAAVADWQLAGAKLARKP